MHVYTRVVYVCRCSRHDVQLAERVSIKFLIDSKKYYVHLLISLNLKKNQFTRYKRVSVGISKLLLFKDLRKHLYLF